MSPVVALIPVSLVVVVSWVAICCLVSVGVVSVLSMVGWGSVAVRRRVVLGLLLGCVVGIVVGWCGVVLRSNMGVVHTNIGMRTGIGMCTGISTHISTTISSYMSTGINSYMSTGIDTNIGTSIRMSSDIMRGILGGLPGFVINRRVAGIAQGNRSVGRSMVGSGVGNMGSSLVGNSMVSLGCTGIARDSGVNMNGSVNSG